MGFDILQRVRSIKLSKNANDTVTPDDFVSLVKIGVVGDDGHVCWAQAVTSTSPEVQEGVAFWSTATVMVYDRVDAKGSSSGPRDLDDTYSSVTRLITWNLRIW